MVRESLISILREKNRDSYFSDNRAALALVQYRLTYKVSRVAYFHIEGHINTDTISGINLIDYLQYFLL